MTDMTLAERESLEALMRHASEQTRTDAEKAKAQARFEQQMRDLAIMLACENGAARIYLGDIDLATIVRPGEEIIDIFRSLSPEMQAEARRKVAAQRLDIGRPVELLDPVTGECRYASA